jgi:hypothetical protein
MGVKERCISVMICPWCGCSEEGRFSISWLKCNECKTIYHFDGTTIITVPESSKELKNKNRDKIIRLQGDRSPLPEHFVGLTFIKNKESMRIAMCPWCGCSISNFEAPFFGKRFECIECGTKYGLDWTTIFLLEDSTQSRDKNVGKVASFTNKGAFGYGNTGRTIRLVCPWCRESRIKSTDSMITCEECGTTYSTRPTFSIILSENTHMKDKNREIHKA